MMKLDCTSTQFLDALGSEFDFFPKDVSHTIEITFTCENCDITEAVEWVMAKIPNRERFKVSILD